MSHSEVLIRPLYQCFGVVKGNYRALASIFVGNKEKGSIGWCLLSFFFLPVATLTIDGSKLEMVREHLSHTLLTSKDKFIDSNKKIQNSFLEKEVLTVDLWRNF